MDSKYFPDFGATTGIVEGTARSANPPLRAELRGGLLTIRTSPEETGRATALSIYGQDGNCVARYGVEASSSGIQSFDFSKAPAGHYFAVLQSDKSRQSSPFVKPQGDLR